jgi:hypothetical protein
MEAKLTVLNMFWDQQIKKMIDDKWSKETNKTKKKRDKELIDMSMKLSPLIRNRFLMEWLKMCKAKH